jgi:hypothetical protein
MGNSLTFFLQCTSKQKEKKDKESGKGNIYRIAELQGGTEMRANTDDNKSVVFFTYFPEQKNFHCL